MGLVSKWQTRVELLRYQRKKVEERLKEKRPEYNLTSIFSLYKEDEI